MFLDEVEISVAAGRGGAGSASMRREKFVPRGGPDGGDGGRGGDVLLVADPSVSSLQGYQATRQFRAASGGAGGAARRHGADGDPVRLVVPPGTMAWDRATGRLLADLERPGQSAVLASGGRGGWGNTHYATPTHQAPRRRELGEPGDTRSVRLELRLIAELGIVGLPNAGKSTLLARLTGAHPKIADYPFTTLSPNLGVLELGSGRVLTVADVPGLIEGAHQGAGLGPGFLRHLERTSALLHLVDGSGGRERIAAGYREVSEELRLHGGALAGKPRLLVLNKRDLMPPETVTPLLLELARELSLERPALAISAATGAGCEELLLAAESLLQLAGGPAAAGEEGGFRLYPGPRGLDRQFTVGPDGDGFRVVGESLERLVARTDLDDDSAVLSLQRRLQRMGVERELLAAGARDGDQVWIGQESFTFYPDPDPAEADGPG